MSGHETTPPTLPESSVPHVYRHDSSAFYFAAAIFLVAVVIGVLFGVHGG